MRNLKKILALVLALMMVLSVMVTASAASFADADEIDADYTEAVEVLSAIGVIDGFKAADGSYSFQPNGTLTRAQAAKIVSYILTGDLDEIEETAEAIDMTFTDVPNWAQPYVAYCYNEGIINGRNATTYDPNGKVTGYELGKMLLIAAGICDADDFVDDWKVVVAAELKDGGIWAGTTYDFSLAKQLTREEACYLTLNAMKAGGSTIVLGYKANGNPNLVFDTYLEAYVVGGNNPANVEAITETSGDLLSDVFGVAYSTGSYAGSDIYGRPANEYHWLDANSDPVDLYFTAEAVAKYTSAVSATALEKALAKYTLGGYEMDETYTVVSINNTLNGSNFGVFGIRGDTYTVAQKLATFTGNGNVVEIYADANNNITDIVRITYSATQASVATAAYGTVYTVGSYSYVDYNATYEAAGYVDGGDLVMTSAIADYDWVTYNEIAGVAIAYPTTSVVGTVTARNTTYGTVTLGGTKLTQSAATAVTVDNYAIGTAYDLSVDQYGYVVGVTHQDTVIPTEYVYVYQIQTQAYGASSSDLLGNVSAAGKTAAAVAKVAHTDGTVDVINLALTATNASGTAHTYAKPAGDGTVDPTATLATLAATNIGAWFAYSVDANGNYTLATVDSTYAQVLASDVTIPAKNSVAVVTGKYNTSATTITTVDTAGNYYEVDTITGLYGAAITLPAAQTLVVYNPTSNVVSAIYAVDSAISTVPTAPTYYYAAAQGDDVYYGTEWTFYVNGEAETLVIYGGGVSAGDVVTLTDTGYGFYTVASTATPDATQVEVTLADDTFIVAGSPYYYSPYGCAVYNVTTGTAGTADVIEAGDYVTIYTDGYGMSLVYIVNEP